MLRSFNGAIAQRNRLDRSTPTSRSVERFPVLFNTTNRFTTCRISLAGVRMICRHFSIPTRMDSLRLECHQIRLADFSPFSTVPEFRSQVAPHRTIESETRDRYLALWIFLRYRRQLVRRSTFLSMETKTSRIQNPDLRPSCPHTVEKEQAGAAEFRVARTCTSALEF